MDSYDYVYHDITKKKDFCSKYIKQYIMSNIAPLCLQFIPICELSFHVALGNQKKKKDEKKIIT